MIQNVPFVLTTTTFINFFLPMMISCLKRLIENSFFIRLINLLIEKYVFSQEVGKLK